MIHVIAESFDQSVVNTINEWANDHRALVQTAKVATWFGNSLTLTGIVIAAVVALLVRRHGLPALYLSAAASVGGLLNSTLKALVGRARPVVEHPIAVADGKSFPSGHAMS